jgi:hypothetical protein
VASVSEMKNLAENLDSMPAIKERIFNMEKHVGLVKNHQPIPQNIYAKVCKTSTY